MGANEEKLVFLFKRKEGNISVYSRTVTCVKYIKNLMLRRYKTFLWTVKKQQHKTAKAFFHSKLSVFSQHLIALARRWTFFLQCLIPTPRDTLQILHSLFLYTVMNNSEYTLCNGFKYFKTPKTIKWFKMLTLQNCLFWKSLLTMEMSFTVCSIYRYSGL